MTNAFETEAKCHPFRQIIPNGWSTKRSKQHGNHITAVMVDAFDQKSNCTKREYNGKENGRNEIGFVWEKVAFKISQPQER